MPQQPHRPPHEGDEAPWQEEDHQRPTPYCRSPHFHLRLHLRLRHCHHCHALCRRPHPLCSCKSAVLLRQHSSSHHQSHDPHFSQLVHVHFFQLLHHHCKAPHLHHRAARSLLPGPQSTKERDAQQSGVTIRSMKVYLCALCGQPTQGHRKYRKKTFCGRHQIVHLKGGVWEGVPVIWGLPKGSGRTLWGGGSVAVSVSVAVTVTMRWLILRPSELWCELF